MKVTPVEGWNVEMMTRSSLAVENTALNAAPGMSVSPADTTLDKLRTAHLPQITCPVLICQGERDPFGKRAEVEGYGLPGNFQVEWIPDGDHQMRSRPER